MNPCTACLGEAPDWLPQTRLLELAKRYLDLSMLQPDGKPKETLLEELKAFQKASLRGEYYQSFNANSKNYTEKPKGTRAWIANCQRLLDRCAHQDYGRDKMLVVARKTATPAQRKALSDR